MKMKTTWKKRPCLLIFINRKGEHVTFSLQIIKITHIRMHSTHMPFPHLRWKKRNRDSHFSHNCLFLNSCRFSSLLRAMSSTTSAIVSVWVITLCVHFRSKNRKKKRRMLCNKQVYSCCKRHKRMSVQLEEKSTSCVFFFSCLRMLRK